MLIHLTLCIHVPNKATGRTAIAINAANVADWYLMQVELELASGHGPGVIVLNDTAASYQVSVQPSDWQAIATQHRGGLKTAQ